MFGKKDKLTEEQVKAALAGVVDPIFEKNLVELGWVKDVKVERKRVRVGLSLPTPAWEPRLLLEQEIRGALGPLADGREVDLAWGSDVKPARPDAMGGQNLVPAARNIILVASGKGGVGKSTVAANLAAALADLGANVGLLDADIYGPSIPTMFGTREKPAVAPSKKLVPVPAHGLKLMSIGFIVNPEEAMVWRGPMLQGALLQFLKDVDWGDLDYLILDLPPGTGDVQLTLAQNVKVAGAVLVSTPQDVALADVTRGKAMFDRVDIPVMGVVENMTYFQCPSCDEKHHIFDRGGASRLASELGVPVLAELPIEIGVRQAADQGRPAVLADPNGLVSKLMFDLARRIATELAQQAEKAGGPKKSKGLRIVQ